MSFALSSSAQGDALDDHLIAIQGIPVSPDKLLVNTAKNNEVLVYNAIKKASAGHTQRVTSPLHPVLGPNVSTRELEIIGGQ